MHDWDLISRPYLNYRIYRFYKRKNDSTPEIISFFAVLTLVGLNIETTWILMDFFYPMLHYLSQRKVLLIFAIVALIHYLILYRGKRYEEIYNEFDRDGHLYKKWDLSVSLYIVLSIVYMLIVIAVAIYRRQGYLF